MFPMFITEEMQQDLMEEVLEKDINKIISTFQKGKSLGLDGSNLELFLGFYELVKDDLLKVVRES